jgi:hypothetical protein
MRSVALAISDVNEWQLLDRRLGLRMTGIGALCGRSASLPISPKAAVQSAERYTFTSGCILKKKWPSGSMSRLEIPETARRVRQRIGTVSS